MILNFPASFLTPTLLSQTTEALAMHSCFYSQLQLYQKHPAPKFTDLFYQVTDVSFVCTHVNRCASLCFVLVNQARPLQVSFPQSISSPELATFLWPNISSFAYWSPIPRISSPIVTYKKKNHPTLFTSANNNFWESPE